MKTGVVLGFVLALMAFGSPALAQRWGGGETLDRILPQIRAHHPGRLSDAEPFVGEDGDTHYRIKWMTPEGRIIYFDADGRSGRWTNSRGYEGNRGDEGGGNRGYQDDGPPRDYDRGGDDGRPRGGRNWQGGDGRQNLNDDGGGRGWPDQSWSGGDGRRGGGDWNGNGRGGHDWNGGRGWPGGGGRPDGGGSHHHGGH